MSDRMPEYMSDKVPGRMSEYIMSDRMPEYIMQDRLPECMSNRMPNRMSEYMSDSVSEYIEYMFKYTSWWGSHEVK